ncbi:uncharacterized protein LOC127874217 [Dreissena polymorpha]|uniref:Uncharacterized protein n=1 Tax=Dreissena polymorpha TaxID=45954 RepID=A0A9D4L002_DREPO|nr:uncharacterized protein LOC127874217 [Dreissena polymorpha]KAH3849307.1 hypothetical protein DPMN_091706 [Dreissena polymorpha]
MMYRLICVSMVCAWIQHVGKCEAATTSSLPNTTTIYPVKNVSKLHCYTCYGVGPTNPCLNYSNFKVAYAMWRQSVPNWDGPVKVETCESPYNVSCMTLTYNNIMKVEVAHSRSCSDNETFGLDIKKETELPYTNLVQNDNRTRCAWNETICLSLCIGDSDEPCNGPQMAGSFISASGFLLVIGAFVQVVNSEFLLHF